MAELDFKLDVLDERGKAAPLTDYGHQVKGDGSIPIVENYHGNVNLLPGESFKREIAVSKIYDFAQPGKYTVQAERRDDENGAVVKSNTVTVAVASPK